jgi:hypothetical protein
MPQFGKLMLRFTNPREPPDKAKVFQTIQKTLKLPLTGLRELGNGFNAFTEFETDVEHLLGDRATEVLNNIGLEAKLPPKIRAQRSIICRQVDSWVGRHSAEEIKEDINKRNSQLKVNEIIKFRNLMHVFN